MSKYIDKEKLLETIDKRRKDAWHNPILQEMLEYAYSIVEACDVEDIQLLVSTNMPRKGKMTTEEQRRNEILKMIEEGKLDKNLIESFGWWDSIVWTLDKFTPRKPLKAEKGSWAYEAFGGEFYACDRCAEILNGERWSFCPNCGQKIDWSEEENE